MLHKLIKTIAPVAALAIGAATSGCSDANFRIGGSDGVPLAELDRSGSAPDELVLASPDDVVVVDGSALDIDVSGDAEAVEALRFTLEDGALGIMRDNDAQRIKGKALVHVALPSLRAITLAGSGRVTAARLSGDVELTIAGSGSVDVAEVEAGAMDMTIAGSGSARAAGRADSLDLTIAGSGEGAMAGLTVDRADITVAGSGDAEFASDGRVDASIMGSGTVTVNGRATCEVSSMGSGKLVCRPASADDDGDETMGEPAPAA